MTENTTQELRVPRSSKMLEYIAHFSATEKFVFGVFIIAALVTAIAMANIINDHFSREVPAHGGTLREGAIGLPRNVNPILAITDIDRDLSSLVYSGLMRYSDGTLKPDIAQSYTISPDGLTYTFKLKSDLRFQDGHTLTADDILFTIQKVQDPALKSPRRIDWADVSAKVISPTEIQFVLKKPYGPFLSNATLGILPEHVWGTVNDDQFIFSQYNIEPIGSGPYRVTSVSRDSGGIPVKYTLSTWRGYYLDQPYLDQISFIFFADESAALAALDQGSIDSVSAISPTNATRLRADSAQAYTVVSSPLPRIFGAFINQSKSPALADKTVRQALDMATDRQAIIDTVLKGYGTVATGPVPFISGATSTVPIKTIIATTSTTTLTSINRAQILLEKNGWQKGVDGIYTKKTAKAGTLTLAFDIYTVDNPDLRQTAEMLKDAWTSLGVRVNIKIYDTNDFYQNVIRTRDYDVLLFGEVIGKDRDLYAFWHSSQRNAPGLNVSLYANSKADKILEDMRATTDEGERQKMLSTFDQMVRADIPAIFLYEPDFIYVVPKSIHGMTIEDITSPNDRWSSLANWYTQTERVWNIFID